MTWRQRTETGPSPPSPTTYVGSATGFTSLEDGLVDIISGTRDVGEAFGDMASAIVADLARIAVQALILKALDVVIPGASAFLGAVKKADGGMIYGPGGPRDDAVPAMLSAGEYVVNAAATARHRPLLDQINGGRLPRFADGGPVLPTLRAPSLPQIGNLAAGRREQVHVIRVEVGEGANFETRVTKIAGNASVQVVRAAAPNIVEAAKAATAASLVRPTRIASVG